MMTEGTTMADTDRFLETDTTPGGSLTSAPPVRTAIRDMAAMAISILQFGLAIGATIASSDVDPGAGLAAAVVLAAGASQLAAIGLLDAGAGVAVATGTAILINLRFVLYSDGIARWFATEPRWRRYALAAPLSDPVYVVCERRFGEQEHPDWRRRYYVAVAIGLVGSFTLGQLVGYLVGHLVPPGFGLELATPLVFGGLLGLSTRGRSAVVSAGTAALVVVAVAPLLGGLALTAAVVAGVAVAATLDGAAP